MAYLVRNHRISCNPLRGCSGLFRYSKWRILHDGTCRRHSLAQYKEGISVEERREMLLKMTEIFVPVLLRKIGGPLRGHTNLILRGVLNVAGRSP
jgi:hypothetical protein